MAFQSQIAAKLNQLAGFSGTAPNTVTLAGPNQVELDIDLTAVDTMSCSFREIRLRVPSLVDAGTETLKSWANALSTRVTYLLENIGPLEIDADSGKVLIRSTPPDQQSNATTFYEIILQSHADGNFSLRRFRSEKGQPGRQPVDIQTTREVLTKLIDDLVETIPAD